MPYKTKEERHANRERRRRAILKVEVLSHYSPHGILGCSWEGCTVTDVDMLTLDHINNDGAEDRKTNQYKSSTSAYFRVKDLGFPDEFQTLCHNHQWKKEISRRRTHW